LFFPHHLATNSFGKFRVCRLNLTKCFANILDIFTKISKPENWKRNYWFQLHLLFSFVCGAEWIFSPFFKFLIFEKFAYFIKKKTVKYTGISFFFQKFLNFLSKNLRKIVEKNAGWNQVYFNSQL